MANTIMTAKNSFAEGLIMDFAPDNTQATCMTSALNATLLTFNGNEMSLQNDMGNGRVETARLPAGYIPVGTCEFGDIIYIVSYNPIINKSQIGCFPSPERNISSEEISTLGQVLSWSDFQEGSYAPNGRIKNTSVKKILLQDSMNPGDKYIIYTKQNNGNISDNGNYLSDYGNESHTHDQWPKLTKIHIVSIEDSGKIIYLDSSVKWYEDIHYYIQSQVQNSEGKPDLDSYRSLVNTAYSIFQSKVSGKLALLVELEKINSFSCSHSVYSEKDGNNTKYHVFANVSWSAFHNDINPNGIILTKSNWLNNEAYVHTYEKDGDNYILKRSNTSVSLPREQGNFDYNNIIPINRLYKLENPPTNYSDYINNQSYNAKINTIVEGINKITLCNTNKYPDLNNNNRSYYKNLSLIKYENGIQKHYSLNNGKEEIATPITISDDVVNNYFKKDVVKYIGSISVPTIQEIDDHKVQTDLKELIWNYSIAPTMPYGVLDYLEVDNTIDFSKINSGLIDLKGWKYYNNGNVSTLSISLESYPEENKGISEVVLEFYDNQGKAAAYHISNKNSYSGTFVEYIELNTKNSNYKQNNIGRDGNVFTHKGQEDTEGTIEYNGKKYYDDAGIIYGNALYRVLITVKYCGIDSLGNYNDFDTSEYKYFARWMYTTEMFNNYYFSVSDFDTLKPSLTFDVSGSFSDIGLEPKIDAYNSYPSINPNSNFIETLGANVYSINQDKSKDTTGNINMKTSLGLEEDYGVFNLNRATTNNINMQISLGDSYIDKTNEPKQLSEEESLDIIQIRPVIADKLNSLDDGTLNRSGYISYLYGDNKTQVSQNLLNLINGTETEPIANFDRVGATTGDKEIDIYESNNAYLSYLDAFSMNFSNAGNINTIPLTYLSTRQGEKILNKYVSCNQDAYDMENTGINLTLTGIFFNKFVYGKIITNSEVKCLKSIINQSDLATYGMRLDADGHLYFKDIQTFWMGESGGKDTRYGAAYTGQATSKGWMNTYEWEIARDGHDEWRPDLVTNDEVQNDLLANVNNYFIPFVIAKTNSSNGQIEGIITNRANNNTYQKYVKSSTITFNDNRKLYPGNKVITGDGNNCNNAPCVVTFLCFRDEVDGKVKITNDPFTSTCYNQGFVGNDNSTIGIYKGSTQADMIGGLYSQLYSVVNDFESLSIGDNFIYLDSFSEQWSKDIIVSIGEITNANNLILFHGEELDIYCGYLLNNPDFAGIKYSDNNIKYSINSVTKTIAFQFNIGYNVQDIKLQYNTVSKNQVKVFQYDLGGNEVPIYAVGDVVPNTLYTIDGARVIPFSNASTIYDIKSWGGTEKALFPVNSGNVSKANLADLSQLLYVTGGVLHISDISKLKNNNSTFDIIWWGTGDDPGLCGISGGSLFNKLKI